MFKTLKVFDTKILTTQLKFHLVVSHSVPAVVLTFNIFQHLQNTVHAPINGTLDKDPLSINSRKNEGKKSFLILEHSHHHSLQFYQVLRDYNLN